MEIIRNKELGNQSVISEGFFERDQSSRNYSLNFQCENQTIVQDANIHTSANILRRLKLDRLYRQHKKHISANDFGTSVLSEDYKNNTTEGADSILPRKKLSMSSSNNPNHSETLKTQKIESKKTFFGRNLGIFGKHKPKSRKISNRIVSVVTDSEIGDRALLDESLQQSSYDYSPQFKIVHEQGDNTETMQFSLKMMSYGGIDIREASSSIGQRQMSTQEREELLRKLSNDDKFRKQWVLGNNDLSLILQNDNNNPEQ